MTLKTLRLIITIRMYLRRSRILGSLTRLLKPDRNDIRIGICPLLTHSKWAINVILNG